MTQPEPAAVVLELDHVYYWVQDMERAVEFYRDVIGLRLLRQDGDSWAVFDAGGKRFALHRAIEGRQVSPGGATAVFSVADLDRSQSTLVRRGVEFGHEAAVEGFARFATFHDPDGNTVQLIEYARPQAESGPELKGVH